MRIRLSTLGVSALTFLAAAAAPAPASAQAFGYAFAAPILVSNLARGSSALHVGGGGEEWIGNGNSIGGELGYLYVPASKTNAVGYSSSVPPFQAALLAMNASHHFPRLGAATDAQPFVTGGVSFLASGESIAFLNAGGGVDWWLSEHSGLRFEARDQFFVGPYGAGSLMLGVRFGVVVR